MAPLMVMITGWLFARVLGYAGWWPQASSWKGALRVALALMFMFTAATHFHPQTRPDLVRMVPPMFPAPDVLVTVTGLLEFAAAAGLVIGWSSRWTAYGLIVLLAAMFPANIYAAQEGLMVGGRVATPLVWRLPLQLFWMWALWWAAAAAPRGGAERRGSVPPHPNASATRSHAEPGVAHGDDSRSRAPVSAHQEVDPCS
jgi:uncharacterized membrane protein